MSAAAEATLHDWLFARVQSVCFDREYVYRSFVEHFGALMGELYAHGGTDGDGTYEIPGIKSGLRALLRWELGRQLSFHGPNPLRLRCSVMDGDGVAVEEGEALFDLSSGETVTAEG